MRFILGVIMTLALTTLAFVGNAFGQTPAAPATTTTTVLPSTLWSSREPSQPRRALKLQSAPQRRLVAVSKRLQKP